MTYLACPRSSRVKEYGCSYHASLTPAYPGIHKVFLLVDEGTIRRYKADLTDEIEPQINELLSRAEKGLQVLLKRESMLQAKVILALHYRVNLSRVHLRLRRLNLDHPLGRPPTQQA